MSNRFKSEKEKLSKLKQFKSIYTLDEKFAFWENVLKYKYITYLILTSANKASHELMNPELWKELHEFEIIPNEKQIQDYNNKILSDYSFYYGTKNLLNLESLISQFELRLEKAFNKYNLIDYEIDKIKAYIVEHSTETQLFPTDMTWSFFKSEFESVYINESPYDYSEQFHEYDNLIALNNGKVCGFFLRYLQDQKVNLSQDITPTSDDLEIHSLNHRINELRTEIENLKKGKRLLRTGQLMLLYHHTGGLKSMNDLPIKKNQKGKLISILLNVGSEEPERNLDKIGKGESEYETNENYDALLDLMDDLKLTDWAKTWKIKKS